MMSDDRHTVALRHQRATSITAPSQRLFNVLFHHQHRGAAVGNALARQQLVHPFCARLSDGLSSINSHVLIMARATATICCSPPPWCQLWRSSSLEKKSLNAAQLLGISHV
jgi:hypothetical protein